MYESKDDLRNYYLKLRKNISKEQVKFRSRLIIDNLKKFLNFNFTSISLYYPINNEVDLLELAEELLSINKIILFPKVIENDLYMCKVEDLKLDFVKGAFNIFEPTGNIYNDQIDLILTPGIVFGHNGYRIGYGKGFYDRFLLKNKSFIKYKIGISYNFQLIEMVPYNNSDCKLDFIITENQILRINNE